MAQPVEPTAENLAPLIVGEDPSAHYVKVAFKCPVSGDEFTGTAKIEREQEQRSVGGEIKKSFWRSLRYSIGTMVRGAFGYGMAGQIGNSVAQATMQTSHIVDFKVTPEQLAWARIDAFKSVQARFAWDDKNGRWVSARVLRDLQPELVTFVQKTQITQAWDQGVLARMLTEIAAADGELADGERELFHAFVGGGGVPSLDELLERPPLTGADLGETTQDVRFAIWLLAAAMAVTDRDIAATEKALLDGWAKGLGIGAKDQQRGLDMAKDWVIDQAFDAAYGDGKLSRDEHAEVYGVAATLGVPSERVDRMDAKCRKRRGII